MFKETVIPSFSKKKKRSLTDSQSLADSKEGGKENTRNKFIVFAFSPQKKSTHQKAQSKGPCFLIFQFFAFFCSFS
jgi:hypothetical protein